MTREEAIEVYNGLINQKIKEAFEFFAPELKESEDERNERLEKLIIESVFCRYGNTQEYLDVIAYFEKQKEQKPSWSEEDENMLNDILGILHSTEDAALANFSEQKKWLKSFCNRPKTSCNWKPTEEQMEALEDVIEAINFKINLGSLHLYKRGAIGELYQQLRKL